MEKASSFNPQIRDLDGSIKEASDTEGDSSSNPEIKNLDVFVVAGNKCGGVESACLGKVLAKERLELGHKIEENERAELLLQSLPDSYDQLIINLTNNILVEYLVFDDVAAAVLEEESRRKNKEDRSKSSQQAEALTMMRGRSTERGPSGSHNHGRSKSRSRKNVKCYSCGKKGHVKSECWHNKKKSGDNRASESSSSQGCVASTSDDGEVLYSEGNTVAEGRKRFADVWLLDSAATWHMTSRREWFHKYEPVSGGSVFMGNDHALEIAGIGTIKIKMHDGTIRSIQEVRHVKGLKKNLLSLGQLDDLGCKTQIENGILKIVRGALVVMKAEKITSNLYMLKGETLQEADSCVASNNHGEESTIIWHRKLGHISERGLKILFDQNLLPGLKSVSLPFCEHCVTSLHTSKVSVDSPAILEKSNVKGMTALDIAALTGNTEAVKVFVEKYKRSLSKEEEAVLLAALWGRKETVRYLLSVTYGTEEFALHSGALLLKYLIESDFHDIPVKDSQDHIAWRPSDGKDGDLEMQNRKSSTNSSEKFPILPQIARDVPSIKRIHDQKLMHIQTLEIVRMMISEVNWTYKEASERLKEPVLTAASLGIHEFVDEVLKAYQNSAFFEDEKKRNIFLLAISYRKEMVFSLIHDQLALVRDYCTYFKDSEGGNILHLAAKFVSFADAARVAMVPGTSTSAFLLPDDCQFGLGCYAYILLH
ncbi:hypothetical protein EZV62_007085 [Acer yangbiense]|uniref:CCHC-type domain-containing protein n=1 Tax=Acer yangbiense TaxID=1000413 RepID=A0A5C7I8Z5_9ROSI|nr:hypothetical protein EZV62_007085 [Acer yangbiense]